MLKHDAFFFVGLLVFLFVIWVATGGPSRPISWAGPFLNPPAPLGNGQAYFLSGAGFKIGTSDANLSSGETISSGSTAASITSFGPLSPHRGEVIFSSGASGAKETIGAAEYLTIRSTGSARDGVVISGWRLVSAKTGSIGVIPNGTAMPSTGVNSALPIELLQGDSAIINTGTSPIGYSFKENLCTGYFTQHQQFVPDLDRDCPSPTAEYDRVIGRDDNYGSDADLACQDYLRTISPCQSETMSNSTDVPFACRQFASQELSYNSCVRDHEADQNFAGNEWRIYLGNKLQLWAQPHDTIRLVDETGKTVDVLSY